MARPKYKSMYLREIDLRVEAIDKVNRWEEEVGHLLDAEAEKWISKMENGKCPVKEITPQKTSGEVCFVVSPLVYASLRWYWARKWKRGLASLTFRGTPITIEEEPD